MGGAHEFLGGEETAGDEAVVEEVEVKREDPEPEIPEREYGMARKSWTIEDVAALVASYPLDGEPPRGDSGLAGRLGRPPSAIYSKWRSLLIESHENEEAAKVNPDEIADAVGKVLDENVNLKRRLTVIEGLLQQAVDALSDGIDALEGGGE